MAKAVYDGWNLKIELDHAETVDFTDIKLPGGSGAVAGLLTVLGVPPFAVGVVAATLAAHAAWEIPLIKSADKGHGVFLVCPIFPMSGIVMIPYPRYEVTNDGWSSTPDSTLESSEGDVIETHIESISDPNVVVFRLSNQAPSGWSKAFILRDGLGGQWWIQADGFNQAENGLYADQLKNGQMLTFWKPKILGRWTEMFSVGELEKLQPGSLVTFTWTRDEGA